MTYAFIDDWLYVDINGKTEVYGRQEIDRNLRSRIKALSIAFLDCQSKMIALTDKRNGYEDALINSSFSEEYILMKEKMDENVVQVIAAKKERVQEIYKYFKGMNVQNLVPYPVAVRAFLRSKGFLEGQQRVVFLDDLKNQAILTLFEGMSFSSPRRISLRDSNYMVSEIKRSWNSFLLERLEKRQEADSSFILVCNNQQWLSTFMEEGFLDREHMFHVEDPFAVLEGLKNAKFTMHFALPQEILKQKKCQLWRERLKVFVMGGLSIFLVLGSYAGYFVLKQNEFKRHRYLLKLKQHREISLKEAYQQSFLSLLSRKRPLDYVGIYYDFIRSIPVDYLIDNIQLHKNDDNLLLQAVIYPSHDHIEYINFMKRGVFSNARISYLISHKVLGQRVELILDGKG